MANLSLLIAVIVVVCAAAFFGSLVINTVIIPFGDRIERWIWRKLGGVGNPPERW